MYVYVYVCIYIYREREIHTHTYIHTPSDPFTSTHVRAPSPRAPSPHLARRAPRAHCRVPRSHQDSRLAVPGPWKISSLRTNYGDNGAAASQAPRRISCRRFLRRETGRSGQSPPPFPGPNAPTRPLHPALAGVGSLRGHRS